MSTLALNRDGEILTDSDLATEVKRRIRDARDARKRIEPVWHSNLAFAAGRFWLKWDRDQRRLLVPQKLRGKELYTADIITEYRTTALGELGTDDDRPELLLRRDDLASEDFQDQLNRAVSFGWDYEWDGDSALEEARRLCVDLGTSAIRCRFDPTSGPVREGDVPHLNGMPILDPTTAHAQVAAASMNGQTLQFKSIAQGKICWEPLSAFNILVPPGIPHERDFNWECVVRPMPLAKVQEEYGNVADDLSEDTDIGSILGTDAITEMTDTTSALGGVASGDSKSGRLRDHVWLFTYYERPTKDYPQGRTVVLATNKMKLLRQTERLPYIGPDGEPRSGIAYFHWWRVTGRFWSRALIEALKDPQTGINKRRTQTNEIIDRGMPFIIVQKDSRAKTRKGHAVEVIEIDPGERNPIISSGVAPGDWLYKDVDELRQDAQHATGLWPLRLGDNPQNVGTYSQLALLNENEQTKRDQIRREHRLATARLVEDSVYDMRAYWGPDRTISLAGDEDFAEAHNFDATKIPPFFIVKAAKGASQPRTQAAELKKIEQIWDAGIASQSPLPLRWLKDSLEAGEALDIPEPPNDSHVDKAMLENHALLQGEQVQVSYYDPPQVHISIHREAQIQAELAGAEAIWELIDTHIQQHVQAAQENAMQQAQTQMGPPQPPAPGQPMPPQPMAPQPQLSPDQGQA